MIKVFTLNKDKKIELTKEELQKLLDDSYWEGYRAANNKSNWYYTYTTPTTPVNTPWNITCDSSTITLSCDNTIDPYKINISQ